ncbi:dihydrodipicolinate synthase family protein [Oceanibium sediminis]|uniref:dihydrodipicolinate synthase family protein n=1 Tax=Oceanibium sediminis TaxID=2026339 RepID=UPI000DD35D7A|nr:dihydrodipicolinate synthase family protein [Oceanibium sediminis]
MTDSFTGMYAALMTGLDQSGAFDPERQRVLTKYVAGQGLRGLYVGGSSGESGLLESAALLEQQSVVADVARGTGNVLMAHVGLPSLGDSIRLAKNAKTLGYDALSALPPHSYPFTDEEIFAYYKALAAATDLPLIVYEIPIRTGRPLPLELLVRILDLPNVAGIKFTSTDLFKMSMLRRQRPDRLYFFGFDEIFSTAGALGVDGGIGTTYNLFGRLYVAIWEAIQANDLLRARELQNISQEFVEILLQTGVLPGMKAAFGLIGIDCGPTRAPMALRADDPAALLSGFLERADVKEWIAL